MTPRDPHVPKGTPHTSVYLTQAEEDAIHEIQRHRRGKNKSLRKNDILRDGLWRLLKQETGMTKADIEAKSPTPENVGQESKVTPIRPAKKD